MSRIVKVSAYRFYSHCPFNGFCNLHSHSLSILQGLSGDGHTPSHIGATRHYRNCLISPVFYLNSHVFKYSTSTSKQNGPETNHRLLESGVTSRPWAFRLGIVPTALLVLISAGLLLHYNDERRAIPKASQQGSANTISKPSIGGPFTLTDHDGKPITEREFLGHWTLIYFGYTSSPDADPEELQKMAKVIELLELKTNLRINPVFITIDPLRDTPSQLHAYLKEFHPKIMGLTGPVNAVRQVAQVFRVYFKKTEEEGSDYLIDCSHNMYLMDPNMQFARMFGIEYNAEQLTDDIAFEVNKHSKLD